jgi:hypothetical protein
MASVSAPDAVPASSRAILRVAAGLFAFLGPVGWWVFAILFHRTLGQDWLVFDTAAHVFRSGEISLLMDAPRFTAELNRSHAGWLGAPLVFHPWVYPPPAMLLALAFGWLPFGVSYALFMALGLGAMVCALLRWAPPGRERRMLILGTLLCPATAYAIGAGQLTFAVIALILTGLFCLDRRPVLAGLLFSLVAIKPQLALLLPVLMVSGRHYTALGAAIAGGVGLCVVSLLVTGPALWAAWLHLFLSGDPAFATWVAKGRAYGQSVYTCLRILGAGIGVANAGQLLAIAAAASAVWLAFRRDIAPRQRVIVLFCGEMLAAPHVSPYDAVFLGIAATLTLLAGRHRVFARGEAPLAIAVWLTTLINPPALVPLGVITPPLVAALMFVALRGPLTGSAEAPLLGGKSSNPGKRHAF